MIIIDNREEKSGILELFRNSNIEFKLEQLKYGDYLINNQIAIERKTANDFVKSIIDGRLFKQVINLAKYFDYKCLIIEGNPFKTEYDFNMKALEGALVEIAVMLGVPVMFTKSLNETFERIILIYKSILKKQNGLVKRSGYKPKSFDRKLSYILQGLPHIGKIKADRLLKHFGNIKTIANASADNLCEIEGIDKKIADDIFKAFNFKYEE